MSKNKTFLITSALPYANGHLHIGHIAGAYLPADIFSRYQKKNGHDVLFISGTDEHGVPISIKAKKENRTTQSLVDEYYQYINSSFKHVDIEFDYFSRTSNPMHHKTAQQFFLTLHQKGYLIKKEILQFYCVTDKMFLPDRYVQGTCPSPGCLFEGARGDECTSCGQWMEPEKLLDPKCQICQQAPSVKPNSQWFFQLSALQNELSDWLKNQVKLKPGIAKFTKQIIDESLIDRCITRDLSWGIPVPINKDRDKVLYVWFEAPIGYISATIHWAQETQTNKDKWKKYWMNPDCELVHFIGKDNLIFHSVIWPAILIGQKSNWVMPKYIPTNQHLTIQGSKLSTSQGKIIWVNDFLKYFPSDFLRYYLCTIAPENKDTNFSWSHFQEKINNELNNGLGNLANRILNFTYKNFNGQLEHYMPLKEESNEEWIRIIQSYPAKVGVEIDSFKFKDALHCIFELVNQGNRYFESKEPWKLIHHDRVACESVLATGIFLLKVIAGLLAPFLPNMSNQLWVMCGQKIPLNDVHWSKIADPITEPIHIGKLSLLAKKIESKQIEKLNQGLI